jgi:hypothetical protein
MRLARVLFAILAVGALLPGASRAEPQAQTRPALEALAAPLYAQLAALKGIASPGAPPPLQIRTREENRRFIEQELDRRYSPARVEAERKGMVAWGLIPRDYDLRRLFLDLMAEQVSAYYDPRAKIMVLGDWLPLEQQQSALTHELVHALQDREIPLDAFIMPEPGRGDQVLARQSLLEGEAVALTFELLLKAQGGDFVSLPDLVPLRDMITSGVSGPTVSTAPKFLKELLLFPYVEGLRFVHEFRKRQPWAGMSALYRDPPRSTTQILHPEKRLARREDPIPIALPDLKGLLPGTMAVAEDELGEFGLGSIVGLHLGEAAGRAAAAGWRGDHFRVWEDKAGRFIIVYLVALESDRVANAFALTYTTVLEKRHPVLTRKGVPGKVGAIVTWRDGDRAFVVEKIGAEVLILERVPAATADRVRDAVWRARAAATPKR